MAIISKIFTRIVVPAGAFVSIPLIAPMIHAEENRAGKVVKPTDLPIYDVPRDRSAADVDAAAEPSSLEHGVSNVRKALFSHMDTLQDTKQGAIRILQKGGRYTEDAVHYVRDEKNIVPRAVAITMSGLVGLLIGARGGIFKKVLYSTTGILAMSSLCYPQQAVQISQDAYKISRYYSIITYNQIFEQANPKQHPTNGTTPSLDKIAEQPKKQKIESERSPKS